MTGPTEEPFHHGPVFEHHWGPQPGDTGKIREHLDRQRGLDELREVRLDDDRVVRVGSDAEGEADEC